MTSVLSDGPAAALIAMLRETPLKPGEVSAFLDRLQPEERITAVRALGRGEQRRLYKGFDGYAELGLTDLVPPARGDFETVRHFGRNTLPLFTHFEKRFCRPAGQDPAAPGELFGFNFQTLSPVTGPGYFLALEDRERREVDIDYRRVPAQAPPGWPEIRGNERGLSRFVYGFMVDTLRRVSEQVSIGSAARKGKDLGSWFVLCREDR